MPLHERRAKGFRCGSTLLLAAFLLAALTPVAVAIESKCSACEAVASEFQRRLDKEVPRNHLDMRHRLDGNGNRYGKVIPYKESELRVHDLLDDLCDEMDRYILVKDNVMTWVKVTGEGSTKIATAQRPGKAEEKEQRRSLKSYCGHMLDNVEEDLSAAIREGETDNTSARDLMCRVLTKPCGKKVVKDYNTRKAEL
eukprot:CAMPEP_0117657066 /NCGR_PEP_ID=MMETSP0804-20121206/5134_1 /TAXON_ID=1074897 /ORGANISM="Tetraselmis astigmatica, Strain CCMP880" /LENGTH=196 /DNA_ID=CAMNT_0005463499 /DNA_START=107 /DNA_END=697 /DNA_ORIENTATION=-